MKNHPLLRIRSLAIACCSLLFVNSQAHSSTTPARVRDFTESIGVNVHLNYSDTVYGSNYTMVYNKLNALRVKHIRDGLVTNDNHLQTTRLNDLATRLRVSSTLICDWRSGASVDAALAYIKANLMNSVESVEGPNEIDVSGSQVWTSNAQQYVDLRNTWKAYVEELWADVCADPDLDTVAVVGPSLVYGAQADDVLPLNYLGNLCDYGNMHRYSGGQKADWFWGSLGWYNNLFGSTKPVYVTETGHHNAINCAVDAHKPTSEKAAGIYAPLVTVEMFMSHNYPQPLSFIYELVDLQPDPGKTNPEYNFGLCRNDFSEKPSFQSLKNMTFITWDNAANAQTFTPTALNLTVNKNGVGTIHYDLMQKSDGVYYLFIWNSVSVWDNVNRVDLTPADVTANINLGGQFTTVEVLEPNSGSTVQQTLNNVTSFDLTVKPKLRILRMTR